MKKSPSKPAGGRTLSTALSAAGTRPAPSARTEEKTKYAVRFADRIAELIAKDLGSRLKGIEATAKRDAASEKARKQLDINFSTPKLGLALGISLKSVHIREPGGGNRYTHNMKRNAEELRIEASGYHKRQPYAVMVGVLFLPFDGCDDAKTLRTSSSFGSWVRHLRPYAGRTGPLDDADCFERLYIALYEIDGSDMRFFDVRAAPPKNSRPPVDGPLRSETTAADAAPKRSLIYDEFLDELHHVYLRRNSADFEWADGEEEPLAPDETEPED